MARPAWGVAGVPPRIMARSLEEERGGSRRHRLKKKKLWTMPPDTSRGHSVDIRSYTFVDPPGPATDNTFSRYLLLYVLPEHQNNTDYAYCYNGCRSIYLLQNCWQAVDTSASRGIISTIQQTVRTATTSDIFLLVWPHQQTQPT